MTLPKPSAEETMLPKKVAFGEEVNPSAEPYHCSTPLPDIPALGAIMSQFSATCQGSPLLRNGLAPLSGVMSDGE